MKYLTVHIENKSAASITLSGRTSLHIPAQAETVKTLSDTPQTAALLSRLRRSYPALRIHAEPVSPAADNSVARETEQKEPAPDAPSDTDQTKADKEAFAALVSGATEKSGGWWHVSLTGEAEPLKVRAKTREEALDLAYAAFRDKAKSE